MKLSKTGGITGKATSSEERLEKENRKLKAMIGELTMELKKSEYED